eukprot:c17709_g1_i1.p1 GENE.c17709_g1_i1~~c17709_g1_i1.p1  ORF type:complete len:388 (-),score=92.95 c17709_g1_i1:96-1259(-)
MSCPFGHSAATPENQGQAPQEGQPEGLYYADYLALDKILTAQSLESTKRGQTAHEEHLFIVIHQAYELWFKQILFELDSVMDIFSAPFVTHKNLSLAVSRLKRITTIQRVLVNQVDILETMTPLQFLEFRDLLFPASGFQSVQFRTLEIKLGLQNKDRLTYGNSNYSTFLKSQHASEVKELEKQHSLFQLVESWLERTPLVDSSDGPSFWDSYRTSVTSMFEEERQVVLQRKGITEEQKNEMVAKIQARVNHFESLFNADIYKLRVEKGESRLSHKAMQAALLITIYQDEPLMHYPFQLLTTILEIDELLTTWRYRHSQMVHRMLGDKVGTGGSSGFRYLQASAARHRVFTDLFNLSTFLIAPNAIPPLPAETRSLLSFTYEKERQK